MAYRVKYKLITPPHIYIHVVCQFHSIAFAIQRCVPGVSFSSGGSDSAGCPYPRSPLLLQQRKLPFVVYGFVSISNRLEPWGSGTIKGATRNVVIPGSLGLAQAHALTKPPAVREISLLPGLFQL